MFARFFTKTIRHALTAALLLCLAAGSLDAADSTTTAITSVLNRQQDAWNAGNVSEFVRFYSDDCTFFGKQTVVGRAAVQKRYETKYPSPAAMGKLTFSGLEVKQLDADVAIVLGRFHLERTAAGGGNADGIFSLVFKRKAGEWQIVLDHTS